MIGDAVNVESFTAELANTQIKFGGVGLVVCKDKDGQVTRVETFRRCERISITPTD